MKLAVALVFLTIAACTLSAAPAQQSRKYSDPLVRDEWEVHQNWFQKFSDEHGEIKAKQSGIEQHLSNLDESIRDLKEARFPERLARLEQVQEINQKLLYAIFTAVLGLAVDMIKRLVESRRRR